MSSRTAEVEGFPMANSLCLEALRRFPGYSDRSMTHYLLRRYPDIFRYFENTRARVRRTVGHKTHNRKTRIKERHPSLPPELVMPRPLHQVRADYKLPAGTWGVMMDVHIPFHEPRPINRLLEWFDDQKITGIIFGGDLMDCRALSFWRSNEKRDFIREVEQTCDFLDWMKKHFPKCKMIMMQGNHEERLDSYFNESAPELIDMPGADMATILSAEKRGIEILQRKQKVVAAAFTLLHGHEMRGGSSSVSAARWAFLKAKACCAIGHFHSESSTTKTDINRNMITCWSTGCLCDLEPDYNPYGNDWCWGGAILRFDGKKYWEYENRRILNDGRMV